MHERIKELAEQASENLSNVIRNDQWLEKFAELIVQKCVICAEQQWIRNGDTEHNRAVSRVITSIKDYFRVE